MQESPTANQMTEGAELRLRRRNMDNAWRGHAVRVLAVLLMLVDATGQKYNTE